LIAFNNDLPVVGHIDDISAASPPGSRPGKRRVWMMTSSAGSMKRRRI
jgi:hypothetical protein